MTNFVFYDNGNISLYYRSEVKTLVKISGKQSVVCDTSHIYACKKFPTKICMSIIWPSKTLFSTENIQINS